MTQGRITSPFTATSTAAEVVAGIDLRDKRVIVTGGSSGIGVETARALASAGADVTLAVRNPDAGARVGAEINASLDCECITVARLDFLDLGSVRNFAQQWGSTPLHVLVNNADIMAAPLDRTPTGWESQFATPPPTSGTSPWPPRYTTPSPLPTSTDRLSQLPGPSLLSGRPRRHQLQPPRCDSGCYA